MGIDKIIEIAVGLTIAAAVTGQLPKIIHQVQMAQVRLLVDSRTSNWGKLMIIDTTSKIHHVDLRQ